MGLRFGVRELYTHYKLVCVKNDVQEKGVVGFWPLGFLSGIFFSFVVLEHLENASTLYVFTCIHSLRNLSTQPIYIELI